MNDHQPASIIPLSASCAGIQMSQLSEAAANVVFHLGTYLYHPGRGQLCGFVLWSDIRHDGSRGHRIYDHINTLFPTHKARIIDEMLNPKTSNIIEVYYWKFPHESFKKWWIEERTKRLSLSV